MKSLSKTSASSRLDAFSKALWIDLRIGRYSDSSHNKIKIVGLIGAEADCSRNWSIMTERSFANRGSQRRRQIAVHQAPELLDKAWRRARASDDDESVEWKSPISPDGFGEYRGGAVLRCLGIKSPPNRPLNEFWPARGSIWDALACSSKGLLLLVEAKAHIPEAASPGLAVHG